MSSPEPLRPSRRLQSAAAAERDRLGRDLQRLERRADALRQELEKIESERLELRDQLALLARVAGSAEDSPFPQRRTPDKAARHLREVRDEELAPKGLLRGSRIREIAVLLLASSPNPRRPIHYQQWYEILRREGYGIDARDPLAAFLTQITRSPVVRHAGAPGVYALDFDAPSAIREQLHRLESRIAQTSVAAGESADELVAARERRSELQTKARAAERQLEEAIRSLGGGS